MMDPALLDAVLAQRVGADVRDKFYQIHSCGYRIHAQSLRLPDAVLEFYITHSHRVPSSLQTISIDELNLVLSQFAGDDPVFAMSELDTADIEGLKRFCSKQRRTRRDCTLLLTECVELFCYVEEPVLKQSFATTLKLVQDTPAPTSTQVDRVSSTSGQTTESARVPSTPTRHHFRTSFTNNSTSNGSDPRSPNVSGRGLLHNNAPPSAIDRGDRREGVMNPSSYGAPYHLNMGLCYHVFSKPWPCYRGANCPNRHRWFDPSEARWIRSIAGQKRWDSMRECWGLPKQPVLRTKFVE
jgi:hypothetical protein